MWGGTIFFPFIFIPPAHSLTSKSEFAEFGSAFHKSNKLIANLNFAESDSS